MRPKYLVAILVLLALALPASPVRADAVVGVCDEAHFDAALATGGTVTFTCSGTITLATTKSIALDRSIDGSGQTVTISGNNAVRLFIVNAGTTLSLNNLTIANGKDATMEGGAAIYSSGGTLTVSNSRFTGNTEDFWGGAISITNGALTATNSSFSANSAHVGGAVYAVGGRVDVSNSTFSGNDAGYWGGGIYIKGGQITVSDSTFSGNTAATEGGGIFNDTGTLIVNRVSFTGNVANSNGGGLATSGTATVTDSTFSNNSASAPTGIGGSIVTGNATGHLTVSNSTFSDNHAAGGGGIANTKNGTLSVDRSNFSSNDCNHGCGIESASGALTVTNSTFSDNSAVAWGGGFSLLGGTATVSSSTFADNQAETGAGGYAGGGTLTLANSTFSGNSAGYYGGGLYIEGGGPHSVTNCTFSGNGGGFMGGGAISVSAGAVTLSNTIAANSTAGANCDGTIANGGGNLTYGDATCPGINGNPLLGPLQDNGGPTWTMALGPGSAAIDAGSDAICAAPPVSNLDQRGMTRPQGPHCDIGAVEQVPHPAPSPRWSIDIKPGSEPNSVNCRNANSVITVAILTTQAGDATTVDHKTVTFEGASEIHLKNKTGEQIRQEEDVNGDGKIDLVFHFRLSDTHLTCQSTTGTLRGQTYARMPVMATGSIRMVGR